MGKSMDTMKRLTSALLTTIFAATAIAPAVAGSHEHGGGRPSGPAAAAPAAQPQPRNDNGGSKHARAPQAQPQAQFGPQNAPSGRHSSLSHKSAFGPLAPSGRHSRLSRKSAFGRLASSGDISKLTPQERVRPVRTERQRFENQAVRGVPFADVVRPKHAKHFAERSRQFVAGRVVRFDNDNVVLENQVGQTFVVRGWHGRHKHWGNRVLTVPVVYRNGVYYANAQPAENLVMLRRRSRATSIPSTISIPRRTIQTMATRRFRDTRTGPTTRTTRWRVR